jgi:hypothetical protein
MPRVAAAALLLALLLVALVHGADLTVTTKTPRVAVKAGQRSRAIKWTVRETHKMRPGNARGTSSTVHTDSDFLHDDDDDHHHPPQLTNTGSAAVSNVIFSVTPPQGVSLARASVAPKDKIAAGKGKGKGKATSGKPANPGKSARGSWDLPVNIDAGKSCTYIYQVKVCSPAGDLLLEPLLVPQLDGVVVPNVTVRSLCTRCDVGRAYMFV